MDIKEFKGILKAYGLKLTLPRSKMLEVFFLADRAVTYGEILEFTAKTVDRVTVYRTLKALEAIGLIHRINGVGDGPAYALSIRTGSGNAGFKQHLHFCCTNCHGIFCLNEHAMPTIILPEPYQVHSMSLIISGLCRTCNLSANDPD